MFASLFFIILNLLLFIGAIDQPPPSLLSIEPGLAIWVALFLYAALLAGISLQNRWLRHHVGKEGLLFFNNIELLLFFGCFYFVLGAQRLFLAQLAPFAQTALLFFVLSLYFLGLFVCQYSSERRNRNRQRARSNAWLSTCFLIPFVLPFFLLIFISELEMLFPFDTSGVPLFLIFAFNIAIILALLVLLPPAAVAFWRCPELKNEEIVKGLDDLCRRADFHHAGYRIWTVMNQSFTAAIIGITARFRYILFTQPLLDKLSPHALKAVFAHEIGHSRHRHLLIYPFIFFGMMLLGSAALTVFYDFVLERFGLKELIEASPFWETISQIGLIALFILIIALYFRYVFGYFSRIFERQADLYVFELGIPAEHLIEAFDTLAEAYGGIHTKPNWHHYSIQDRIDFIKKAQTDPSIIAKHHRQVRISLLIYACALILLLLYFFANEAI